MGGDLTSDEIGVIRGALDLTSKTARSECTPLDKVCPSVLLSSCAETIRVRGGRSAVRASNRATIVQAFMLPADMHLDEEALFRILRYGHSRIPVHEPGNSQSIRGILLVSAVS